jgi:hypothetical protein
MLKSSCPLEVDHIEVSWIGYITLNEIVYNSSSRRSSGIYIW